MYKYKSQKNSGFTMIEMLIAVFIFTVALTALMSIASRGLRTANQAQKQVVGNYLALEGIEIVRNMRDKSFLALNTSNNRFDNIFETNGCRIGVDECHVVLNSTGVVLEPCPEEECTIYYSEDQSTYRNNQHNSTYIPTEYTRTITLTESATNSSELYALVVVRWNGGEVSYGENLFLWY